jgi:lysophospholipase L1-like esterase
VSRYLPDLRVSTQAPYNNSSLPASTAYADKAAAQSGGPDVQSVLRSMRDGGTVKVVCLGDSITFGQLDVGGTATTPWPARLQALLREYYANSNITVVNAGVSGDTTASMITRFAADVRAQDPHLIVFNGGTNDSREANGVSLDTYRANVEQILALCRPTPVVVMGITPRFKEQRSADGEGVVHFYRGVLQQLAVASGIPYVDTYTRLMALYKSRAIAAGYLSSDGSHYSEDGYRYIGDLVFATAFVNEDLFMSPGQYRDMRGQWLITAAADSTWGGADIQDNKALVISAATVRLYTFVEDWVESNLVAHVVLDRANATNQTVTITNTSVTGGGGTIPLSPNAAAGAAYFVTDCPIPVGRLQPGINNITFATATSARINGFSILPVGQPNYLASYNAASDGDRAWQQWGSTRYQQSTHAFQVLRQGVLTVSNSASLFIEPYFLLVPDELGVTSRWRFRVTARPGAVFYMGQQSMLDTTYAYIYKVEFDGTNCIVSIRDHGGTVRVGATVAKAVAAGGTELTIDITSSASGWSLWVNTTAIFSDVVPLGIGPVFVGANSTDRSYWNPPIKKGKNTSDTGVIIGEEWTAFSPATPVKHLIDKGSVDRTLTYT